MISSQNLFEFLEGLASALLIENFVDCLKDEESIREDLEAIIVLFRSGFKGNVLNDILRAFELIAVLVRDTKQVGTDLTCSRYCK
jgi:hypothetical protein